MAERYREFAFRRLIPVGHDDYLDEPAANVDWFVQFRRVELEIEQDRAARQQR